MTRTARAKLDDGADAAHRLYAVGQVFGVLFVVATIVHRTVIGDDLQEDMLWSGMFAIVGVLLYFAAGQLGVRLLLGRKLGAEIDEGNAAAGLAGGAHHAAMAILVAEVATGDDIPSVGLAAGFFCVGVVAHQLLVAAFRFLTTYDDAEQIAGENSAAALSYAGVSIAVALILARGLQGDAGDFDSYGHSLVDFAEVALLALVLWPVRQVVLLGVVLGARPALRGGRLDDAVGAERDVPLAALEALAFISVALALVRLL